MFGRNRTSVASPGPAGPLDLLVERIVRRFEEATPKDATKGWYWREPLPPRPVIAGRVHPFGTVDEMRQLPYEQHEILAARNAGLDSYYCYDWSGKVQPCIADAVSASNFSSRVRDAVDARINALLTQLGQLGDLGASHLLISKLDIYLKISRPELYVQEAERYGTKPDPEIAMRAYAKADPALQPLLEEFRVGAAALDQRHEQVASELKARHLSELSYANQQWRSERMRLADHALARMNPPAKSA